MGMGKGFSSRYKYTKLDHEFWDMDTKACTGYGTDASNRIVSLNQNKPLSETSG